MMKRESHNADGFRTLAPWLAIGGALIVLLAGIVVWQQFTRFPSLSKSTVTHSLVMQQIQNVAKLVTSEATMRDVVVFEDTWLGSTKRSLVVVTGKVLGGINLERGTDVKIDEAARRITITLPAAEILSTDISEMKTYDEQRGLWNTFTPADRDKIYQQARQQIASADQQAQLIAQANQSAKQLLETMFTRDGFTTVVNQKTL
jgi:Protein of unknown function (DUF4230)